MGVSPNDFKIKLMRKNPLSNCDKRFEDLREAFDSDLNKLKQDLIENV